MKNKISVLLFNLVLVAVVGLSFANASYAKSVNVDSNCIKCVCSCCKDCNKDCSDCKKCCCEKCKDSCGETNKTAKDNCSCCKNQDKCDK